MNITLYQNCALTNQYHNVFRTQALLESYLSNLNGITISDSFYLEYKGTINLTLPLYTTACNYMKYTDNAGNTNYYFITEWNIKNGIYILSYVIDIWHTFIYDTYWNVHYGHQIATHHYNKSRMYLIGEPEFRVPIYPEILSSDTYGVLLFGYRYTGVTDLEGPSKARSYAFLSVNDSDISTWQTFSLLNAQVFAADAYAEIVGNSTTSGGTTYYWNITSIYIVPSDMLPSISNSAASIQPSVTTAAVTGFTMLSAYSTALFSNSDYPAYNNLTTSSKSVSSFNLFTGTINHLRETPKIITQNTNTPYYTKTYINLNGLSIIGIIGSQVDDITEDFAFNVNYTAESALVAVNRNIAAKADIVNTIASASKSIISGSSNIYGAVADTVTSLVTMGISAQNTLAVGGTYSGGTSYGSAARGIASGVNDFIDAANTIAQCIFNRQYQYSTIAASGSTIDLSKMYYGIVSFIGSANNSTELNNALKYYGVICDTIITSLENSGNNFDLILCDDIDITGSLPSQFLKLIETILTNGVRIWNQSNLTF